MFRATKTQILIMPRPLRYNSGENFVPRCPPNTFEVESSWSGKFGKAIRAAQLRLIILEVIFILRWIFSSPKISFALLSDTPSSHLLYPHCNCYGCHMYQGTWISVCFKKAILKQMIVPQLVQLRWQNFCELILHYKLFKEKPKLDYWEILLLVLPNTDTLVHLA